MTKACFHRLLPFAQDGYPLTPASGYIDHLQRKDEDAVAAFPTVLDQIDFKMTRLACVPRNTLHWHGLADLICALWPFLWEALLVAAILAQDPGHGRLANLL